LADVLLVLHLVAVHLVGVHVGVLVGRLDGVAHAVVVVLLVGGVGVAVLVHHPLAGGGLRRLGHVGRVGVRVLVRVHRHLGLWGRRLLLPVLGLDGGGGHGVGRGRHGGGGVVPGVGGLAVHARLVHVLVHVHHHVLPEWRLRRRRVHARHVARHPHALSVRGLAGGRHLRAWPIVVAAHARLVVSAAGLELGPVPRAGVRSSSLTAAALAALAAAAAATASGRQIVIWIGVSHVWRRHREPWLLVMGHGLWGLIMSVRLVDGVHLVLDTLQVHVVHKILWIGGRLDPEMRIIAISADGIGKTLIGGQPLQQLGRHDGGHGLVSGDLERWPPLGAVHPLIEDLSNRSRPFARSTPMHLLVVPGALLEREVGARLPLLGVGVELRGASFSRLIGGCRWGVCST